MANKRSKNKQPVQNRKPVNLYLFIALMIILLPILFSRQTVEPVLGIRMLAWSIFLIVLTIPLVFGFLEKKLEFGFLRLRLFKVFAFYLFIVIISIFWAINPAESYFDIIKTLFSLITLVFATALFVRYENFRQLISKGFIISTIVAGVNGLFQYLQISPVDTAGEMFSSLYEIGGIMGHKNQFAISLFLLMPFSIFGIYTFRKTWLVLSIFSLVIIMMNIVLLQTRSVWVAMLIYIFAAVVLVSFSRQKGSEPKKTRWYRHPIFVAATSFVVIAVLVFSLQSQETRNLFGYKISSLINLESHDNQGRLDVWEATFHMIGDAPVTGVGAGNWKINIPIYIADTHGQSYKNWNQPHNDFLWVLSEKGIFGLLAYLAIFGFVFYYGVRTFAKNRGKAEGVFYMLLLSALVGYFALALVSFPYERVNHQVVLMIMFAAILAGYIKSGEKTGQMPRKATATIFILIAILLPVSLFYSSTAWNSKKSVRLVYAAIEHDNPNAVIKYASDALNSWVSIDEQTTPIYKHRGTAYSMLGRQREALADLEKARKAHPYHVNTLVNLATIYAKNRQFAKAIEYYESAMRLFPKNQQTIKSLSRAYFDNGQYEKAYATILKYNNKKPYPQVEGFREQLESELNR